MAVVSMRGNGLPQGAVRIDRRTKWGNPFVIGRDGTREEVIEQYRHWLWAELKAGRITIVELAKLAEKDLACWCAPKPCHGEVLQRAAAWAARQMRHEAFELALGPPPPPSGKGILGEPLAKQG